MAARRAGICTTWIARTSSTSRPRSSAIIRSTPETPRKHDIPEKTLSEIRVKVEKHIKNTYLKQVQAPMGVRPVLRAWMELSEEVYESVDVDEHTD